MSLHKMRLRPILHLRTLVRNLRTYFHTFSCVIDLRKLHRILCKASLISTSKKKALLTVNRPTDDTSINQFSGPAYPWGVAGAAAQVGASKHLDPLQQRIGALLGCQGETN